MGSLSQWMDPFAFVVHSPHRKRERDKVMTGNRIVSACYETHNEPVLGRRLTGAYNVSHSVVVSLLLFAY